MNTIRRIAEVVRRKNVIAYASGDLKGYCVEVSEDLLKALLTAGFKGQVWRGYFYVDNPDPLETDIFPDDDDADERIHLPVHAWVELSDGTIVDITVSQFNDELEDEEMPYIFIGSYDDCGRYEKTSKVGGCLYDPIKKSQVAS